MVPGLVQHPFWPPARHACVPRGASPEITQTYAASTSQLTLWNRANNTADIIQFAANLTLVGSMHH